jgi:hypothetical protein
LCLRLFVLLSPKEYIYPCLYVFPTHPILPLLSQLPTHPPNQDIVIEDQHFAEGSFRRACRARVKWNENSVNNSTDRNMGSEKVFVCKFAHDANTPRSLYFHDVEAQVYAMAWAKKFNEFKPPHQIEFVPAFVMVRKSLRV